MDEREREREREVILTQILDLYIPSQFCMGATCTDIVTEM